MFAQVLFGNYELHGILNLVEWFDLGIVEKALGFKTQIHTLVIWR